MNLTNKKLIIGILAFLLVVNLLIFFNIDFYYIRAILGFIFLITIPGLLIMLCFKIRNINFWEYLVYTIGLSVAFIMFVGLHANWTLPAFGITDKPLSTIPILIDFDIFLIILTFFAYMRNKDLNFKIKFPKLSWLDRIFMIIPLCFPFMAVIGVFLLNNHGTNIVTMVMLGAIAIYVLLVVIFRDKLNENVFPWAIWMIGLSLLLSFSMRSWFVSGSDANLEFSIFQMTQDKGVWLIDNFKNAYNVMLSVTILPTILSLFSGINPQYIQKLFFTIIFNFLPLIVYVISRKYFNKNISFFAGLFFIFQSGFMKWSWMPSRQQIAFIFFGLMLLVLFSKGINSKLKKLLVLIFGFSMIVSHYSTSYIALAIFLLAYVLTLIYKKWENRKIKKGKLKPKKREQFHLTGLLVLVLLVFGFLWYNQVSDVASGPIIFLKNSLSNLGHMFSEEVQSQGNSPLDQFNIFKKIDTVSLIKEYEESISFSLPNNLSKVDYKIYPKYPSGIESAFNPSINLYILYFREFLKVAGKIFVILGVFYLFIKRKKFNYNFIIFNIACFSILVILLILPFISIQYDVVRPYQQILILSSGSAILGASIIFKKVPKIPHEIFVAIFLIFYFLALSGIFHQIVGGSDISMRLNYKGYEYSSYYVSKPETDSAGWMYKSIPQNKMVNSDTNAITRIFISFSPLIYSNLIRDIHPFLINKNNYVYSSSYSKIEGNYFKNLRGNTVSLNFPTEFLNGNKNKIYNNGGSEIFK